MSPWEPRLSQLFYDELTNVESVGKPPEEAWRDVQHKARRIADHVGLT